MADTTEYRTITTGPTVQHYNHPLHFIGAHECLFHMGTSVGKFIVSTVGDYRPRGLGTTQKEIGYGRTYETYVFNWHGDQEECGRPRLTDLSEIDSLSANSDAEAAANHAEMVSRYTEKANRDYCPAHGGPTP